MNGPVWETFLPVIQDQKMLTTFPRLTEFCIFSTEIYYTNIHWRKKGT